jgi:uncharacterized membrane protein
MKIGDENIFWLYFILIIFFVLGLSLYIDRRNKKSNNNKVTDETQIVKNSMEIYWKKQNTKKYW